MMAIFKRRRTFKYEIFAAVFLLSVTWVYFYQGWNTNTFLLLSAILGIYMAANLWANDVANNMWPAVWSKVLTLTWAIIIAAIFEASWAIIAGWDVVSTIKWWIIDWSQISDPRIFMSIMMATLLGAALWINLATFFRAPVSATHSIIGWLIWAWLAASWVWIVNWSKITEIAASWIISPVMWWIIAAILILSIRKTILKEEDRSEAAKKWVPIYVWIMAWAFSTYLALKWLKQIIHISTELALFGWYVIAVIVFIWLRLHLSSKNTILKNSKNFINKLFNVPLIFAVALLSFAHWANDVANAIWPLAAIDETIKSMVEWRSFWIWDIWIPFWIMLIWALWIAIWLMAFGWRLIKTVWKEITKLNQIRAFSVALSAAMTVIIASHMGLPVSSTHVAIGWIFWVWLLREYIKRKKWKSKDYIEKAMIKNIALAWVITLPISGLISWIAYITIIKVI